MRRIDLVTSGRATPRVAAARLGVTEPTAYYWLKRERRPLALAVPKRPGPMPAKSQPTFVRLIPAAEIDPAIVLRVGGAVIEVRPGFDHALLREVVMMLAECAP